MNTTNKTVIVTGASSGIGYALVEAYLKRGYNVVGNARTSERLQAAAAKLGNPKNFLQVAGDIAKPSTAKELFSKAIAAFGQVDILINNAGIFIAKPIAQYTENDLDSLVNTNLKGFFYPSQEAAEHMAANKQGHIVTITASIAMAPNVKLPALLPILIKGGLNHATRGLALELATSNVKVNAVAPGSIDTPLHGSDDATTNFRKALAPMGQTGLTNDIVDAVLYITDSQFTTGTILTVDGGATAGVW
ncbi:SDR family NAD(P)-dependent oxidoreductase [Herminiimonas fonticola]|uniref:NAD(P)-dependent dehydrogenase (Short-subunit alcohol dehydrogenase family) n=1 Tax=Herminiimonas fonticola TaxID=303380 RepID=A0A4R6G735_9BURK|nr:SDR family oxidoreductase [Herminiimonas fonticola]RBA24327.1 Dehydrogenases with different specificities (related to short-chain alcohol dehydrogenases) [Herminiimonas fonticola]TDN90327.1 NAD(P)-dependent dehydrogenase (short-subunit alcohol dehydrogenase family) [Herminiimonas fonticola]